MVRACMVALSYSCALAFLDNLGSLVRVSKEKAKVCMYILIREIL